MSVNEKMTAIADAIREKTGKNGVLTLEQMATAIESIETGGKAIAELSCVLNVSSGKLIGDINNDGIIDSTDEELAGELMANGEYDEAADLDGDGVISIEDMVFLSRLIAEKQENQIIAKITMNYTDGTSSFAFITVDAPAVGAGEKTVKSITCTGKTSEGVFYGDVNNDGVIDSTDVSLVSSYVVGNVTEIDLEAADVDGDGKVSNTDMITLSGAVENNKMFVKVTVAYEDGTSTSELIPVEYPSSEKLLNGKTYVCGAFTQIGNSMNSKTLLHNLGRAPTSVTIWAEPDGAVANGFISATYTKNLGITGVNSFSSGGTGVNAITGSEYMAVASSNLIIYPPDDVQWVDGWVYRWVVT